MNNLHEVLRQKVEAWKASGYETKWPTVKEILLFVNSSGFLRSAQVHALLTYLYLRCVEETPNIPALYASLYQKGSDLGQALGIPMDHEEITKIGMDGGGMQAVMERIRTDELFAKKHKLEALHETLTLDYPSYILALAMGAGKTILIGSIVAVEFALAMEEPEGPFIQNALVFAPGKTILESLREISEIPFDRILPPRLLKSFLASVKITYTRDGEKDIPVTRKSSFNLIITNTEKIRIQKVPVRQGKRSLFEAMQKEEEAKELANLRLQSIASLPKLGIFSDEAHHLYGQEMEKDLKRVRQTVDYLHENTDVLCVVNTTGTPYYKRQFLRDVVAWYSLSEGIRDNILKDVSGSIKSYAVTDDEVPAYLCDVIQDFFREYGNKALPSGAKAKIALYFPNQENLDEGKSLIERELVKLGIDPSIVLVNTENSSQENVDAFNRLNDPATPYRVILLVNKGTEGWNCPSLFACALIRKLTNANNFVLQASTRCLRQVAGNTEKARIYLSHDNQNLLESQLQETYGTSIAELDRTQQETKSVTIRIRKMSIPPLIVKRMIARVSAVQGTEPVIRLQQPTVRKAVLVRSTLTPEETSGGVRLGASSEDEQITVEAQELDAFSAATELSGMTRLPVWEIFLELKRVYSDADIPRGHLLALQQQLEEQNQRYEITQEEVEEAIALLKLSGFTKEQEQGETVYTATIRYPKSKEDLILPMTAVMRDERHDFGFHYHPYNFDSRPEKGFFEWLLKRCDEKPLDVEDIYFTGGITGKDKTDFAVEYKGNDGSFHSYTPDFLIRMKDGRCVIVEVKRDDRRDDPIEGIDGAKAMEVRKWENLDPKRIKYEMVFARGEEIPSSETTRISTTLSL